MEQMIVRGNQIGPRASSERRELDTLILLFYLVIHSPTLIRDSFWFFSEHSFPAALETPATYQRDVMRPTAPLNALALESRHHMSRRLILSLVEPSVDETNYVLHVKQGAMLMLSLGCPMETTD